MDVASDQGIEAACMRFKTSPAADQLPGEAPIFPREGRGGRHDPLIFASRVDAGLLNLQVTNLLAFGMVDRITIFST
jgi:hypothetical protein